MTDTSYIRELLIRFAEDRCTEAETEELVSYFQSGGNPEDFPEVSDLLPLLRENRALGDAEADHLFEIVLERAKKEAPIFRMGARTRVLKYAVAAVVFIGLATAAYWNGLLPRLFQERPLVDDQRTVETAQPDPGAITLQLPDGKVEVISEDGTTQIKDKQGKVVGRQQGGQLVYGGDSGTEELSYNTLTVPYGKKFELLLSDGTLAYLNAGSSLRYPVTFIKGSERHVFLSGEAYFDVAKDAEHAFVIEAQDLNIKVYGTKFNVSAYQEDEVADVVLVEGSVGLYKTGDVAAREHPTMLTPGHKGSLEKADGGISTEAVSTESYTAWIQGELVFRNMTFNNILKKLERHYNVTLVNQDPTIGEERFNARFRDVSLSKVLGYFEATYGLTYETNGTTITIK